MEKTSFTNMNNLLNTLIKLMIIVVLLMTFIVLYNINKNLNNKNVLNINPVKIELKHQEGYVD